MLKLFVLNLLLILFDQNFKTCVNGIGNSSKQCLTSSFYLLFSFRQSFPGSQPVSMDYTNYETILRSPYMVSWKADGTR